MFYFYQRISFHNKTFNARGNSQSSLTLQHPEYTPGLPTMDITYETVIIETYLKGLVKIDGKNDILETIPFKPLSGIEVVLHCQTVCAPQVWL